jgi:hypothetical protein
MTHYLCLKDLAYIPYYSDGSDSDSMTKWLLVHAKHGKIVKISEFTEGVAVPA